MRRVVYTSFVGAANEDATFTLVRHHGATERAIAATGVPTEYREQTVEEAWATRRPSGHPDWEIEGWVTSYLAIAAGELSTVTDVVPTVAGHPARTVAAHLRSHPEDWAHLRG